MTSRRPPLTTIGTSCFDCLGYRIERLAVSDQWAILEPTFRTALDCRSAFPSEAAFVAADCDEPVVDTLEEAVQTCIQLDEGSYCETIIFDKETN